MQIYPARVSTGSRGPFSDDYQDSYHGPLGALAQARAIFLAQCHLPEAWRNQACHTIIETGFGLGTNFLATWHAWRADPARCQRLHFLSIERHPVPLPALAQAHAREPVLAPLARLLRANLPPPLAGLHRLSFEQGRVQLSLLYGDGAAALAELDASADTVFLDGFAPDRNPVLWQPDVLLQLARLARPGARLASWCSAGHVRRGLVASGFEVLRTPGPAGKFEILQGIRQHSAPPAISASKVSAVPERAVPERTLPSAAAQTALVLGAGVAGTAITEALVERGWQVDLLDSAGGPASGASGNPAGVVRPLWSRDDNPPTRLTRAAFLFAIRRWAGLGTVAAPARRHPGWHPTGVLQLAADAAQAAQWAESLDTQDWPAEWVQWLEPAQVERRSGHPTSHGGLLFALGGWAEPLRLCSEALLRATGPRLRCHWQTVVHQLTRDEGSGDWLALAHDGRVLARAAHVVICTGAGRDDPRVAAMAPGPDGQTGPSSHFTPEGWRPLQALRGEILQANAAASSATPTGLVVCGDGYVSPDGSGGWSIGATYDRTGPLSLTAAGIAENQERLARLHGHTPLAEAGLANVAPVHAGRVAWRSVAADRLPVVGPDPVQSGCWHLRAFASRGLVWSPLMAEALACQMNGEPSPLMRSHQALVDPARPVLRQRRARLPGHQ